MSQNITNTNASNSMFCFQCEQTAGCTGCTRAGVCGKSAMTAKLQDTLTGALIALANIAACSNKNSNNNLSESLANEINHLILEGLFATITNVNFDDASIKNLTARIHAAATKTANACNVSIVSDYDMNNIWNANEDIRSLKSLILFGVRGMAAYAYHAMTLGYTDASLNQFFLTALDSLSKDWGMNELLPIVMEVGRFNLTCTQLPGQLSRCIHPAALCAAAARSFALYRSRKESRLHAEAMRTVFTEQYSAVAEALAVLGEQLGRPGEPEPYRSDRVAAFFTSLGSPPLECAVTLDDLGRTHAAVTLPRTRFGPQELAALAREVGRICRRTLETPQVLSCKGMTTLLFSERPVLRAVFGMAGAAAQGEVSGDAVQQFCSPTAAQMILCDGMGTGRPAAVDGNLAAELTARLLKAGIPAELAARLVNVALALKSEEESGATLDLISVDLYTGTARLFKAGAAPGFLVHGGRARAVGDVSLPVGILGGVNGQSRVVHLCAGDYAVLVSDGLLVDGTAWVAKQLELSAAAGEAPAQVAKTLVETARARALRTGRPDDITAAVLRLENGG